MNPSLRFISDKGNFTFAQHYCQVVLPLQKNKLRLLLTLKQCEDISGWKAFYLETSTTTAHNEQINQKITQPKSITGFYLMFQISLEFRASMPILFPNNSVH
jgi:hypothetical protein